LEHWVSIFTYSHSATRLIYDVRDAATGIAGVALFWQTSEEVQVIIVNLGVAFHSCSVAINIIATALIAGRLLYQRRLIKQLGGDHSQEYLSASAIFAESGALYSITGLVYIPLYGVDSPLIYVFAPLLEAASVSLGIFCCCSYERSHRYALSGNCSNAHPYPDRTRCRRLTTDTYSDLSAQGQEKKGA
jgi:hypothetical protein